MFSTAFRVPFIISLSLKILASVSSSRVIILENLPLLHPTLYLFPSVVVGMRTALLGLQWESLTKLGFSISLNYYTIYDIVSIINRLALGKYVSDSDVGKWLVKR